MTRLISRLDIKSEFLIKGINFEGLRTIGNPNDFAKKYYLNGIDEIIYIDTVATLYGRNNLYHILKKTCEDIFIPISAGGGISTIEDAENLFQNGADKIFINSTAVKNKTILVDLVKRFGSANIIASIEVKKIEKKWFIYTDNGREKSKYEFFEWLKIVQDFEVGEIFITSIDSDGTKKGFDLSLCENLDNKINVPYILSGGVTQLEHFDQIKKNCNPSGIAVGTCLHYNLLSIDIIKKHMIKIGFKNVRF